MIQISERAGMALSRNLSEEDRISGRIFRFNLSDDARIEVDKAIPYPDDEQLEYQGYPVLAVPPEILRLDDQLHVDITPTADGQAIALVVKSASLD